MQVSWSPNHDDKFFTFGTDLCLYRVNDLRDENLLNPKEEGMKISDRTYASLMQIATDVQYKCVAWRPNNSPDHLLAVGLSSGRVQLSCFGKVGSDDPIRLLEKEFVPRHPRPCNFLQWNPVETYLLAEGVERYRQDSSILIWDVCAQPLDYPAHLDRKLSAVSTDAATVSITKPLYELGSSETSHSLAWFYSSPRSIVAGMNNKFLRIFDLREPSRPQIQTTTKFISNVCVDQLFDSRVASCSENLIAIWDTRNFDKPVLTQQQNRNVLKVSWSAARSGLLACISKDSPSFHVYDFHHFASGADEIDPPFVERYVLPSGVNYISSFDWHPTHANRLLTVTPSGAVTDVRLAERVAICWSPDIYLTWACGSQVRQYHSIKLCKEASDDISVKMRRRALKGYGISSAVEDNIKCVGGEEKLRKLWIWISMMKDLHSNKSGSRFHRCSHPYVGVRSILKSAPQSPAKQEFWSWQGMESHSKEQSQRKVYKSEERLTVLEMCGWSFNRESLSLPFIDKLENDGLLEQAAAVAVFHLKLERAINILKRGANVKGVKMLDGSGSNLNVFAMALSGFSDEKNTIWKELCANLCSTISHPYLRAIFYFLTTTDENYEEILNDPSLELSDQIAFACMFVSDARLLEYVDQLTLKYILDGNPCGAFLTGLSEEGIRLFVSYVDRTYDVQTAVVSLIQAFSASDLSKNSQIQLWIETYREFLNRMRLWKERAEFDVYLCKQERTREQQAQLYICCNFCGKSISFESLDNRNRVMNSNTGSGPPIKPRINCCPSCRKPLPRCALCLLHMGTPSGTSRARSDSHRLPEKKLSKISEWFTWCQSCHHGGHAEHLTDWFRDHIECPVSGCSCHCMSMDPGADNAVSSFLGNLQDKVDEDVADVALMASKRKHEF